LLRGDFSNRIALTETRDERQHRRSRSNLISEAELTCPQLNNQEKNSMKITALFLCLQVFLVTFFTGFVRPVTSVSGFDLVDLSGEGAYEIFPGSSWRFVGPVRTIRIGEGQRLIASATAVFGTNDGTTRAAVAICYQRSASDPITPFVGDSHLNVTIDSVQRPYSVHASTGSISGKVNVGFCIVNLGREAIGNNNYVNGWAATG
jgi:hypothetical protein